MVSFRWTSWRSVVFFVLQLLHGQCAGFYCLNIDAIKKVSTRITVVLPSILTAVAPSFGVSVSTKNRLVTHPKNTHKPIQLQNNLGLKYHCKHISIQLFITINYFLTAIREAILLGLLNEKSVNIQACFMLEQGCAIFLADGPNL